MSHSYCSQLMHVVFSTKERKPLLTSDLQPEIWAYIGAVARELGAKAIQIGGHDDHVHALLSLRPKHCVAEIVRDIKANSSRWLRQRRGSEFAWQQGYGAFS